MTLSCLDRYMKMYCSCQMHKVGGIWTLPHSWKDREGPGSRGEKRYRTFDFIHIKLKGTFYNVGKNEMYTNENIYHAKSVPLHLFN